MPPLPAIAPQGDDLALILFVALFAAVAIGAILSASIMTICARYHARHPRNVQSTR